MFSVGMGGNSLLKRDLEPNKFDLLALQSHVECIILLGFLIDVFILLSHFMISILYYKSALT